MSKRGEGGRRQEGRQAGRKSKAAYLLDEHGFIGEKHIRNLPYQSDKSHR